jgi:ParB family chromosome partitioning protein
MEPRVERVPLDSVRASSLQPRRDFPAESLEELADSIRQQGILQPLIVRRQGAVYELIAGERRWRAARMAGLSEVPVIVREADDTTTLELMLVENLQREDLNPMDEAQGYAELMERFQMTQELVAVKVGRNRATVANALRLLKLPTEVQALVRGGEISAGHAKVILGLGGADLQTTAARRVASGGLSVRQAEELVAHLNSRASAVRAVSGPPGREGAGRDPNVVAVEDKLRQRLGTKVTVRYRQGRGQIDIRFFSDAELERLLEIVGVRMD